MAATMKATGLNERLTIREVDSMLCPVTDGQECSGLTSQAWLFADALS